MTDSGGDRRALIVVDVQNDFCPGGSLAVEHGDEVVAPLNRLIEEFLSRGEPVYKSRDWHPADTKHFTAYGGTWPVHCVQGTRGAEFHPQLSRDPRVSEVWVGGLATDYCVKQTVLDALRAGFRVRALSDAMRAVNLHPGDDALAVEEMRRAGAEII
jgi:nicotinamidase/pyrazinamidase